ncbi:unnamed protein product [Calypogeia fissa]
MASEQLSPGSDVASGDMQHEEKHSFMMKVKEKALKLKHKLKHDSPTSGNAAQGPTDKDLDQSDTTESEGEGKHDDPTSMPHPTRPAGAIIPNSEDSPTGAVGSGQSGSGADTMKTEDKSFPQDPSVLKSEGPAETEQAVPTNYSYFNADPEKANLPSDHATSQRQQEVPSSLDGESAEVTPAMEKLDAGTENPSLNQADPELQDEQKNEAGLVEPSQPSEESLMSEPVEQDQGVTSREPSSLNPQTPQNSPQDEEEAFSGFATDTPSTDKGIDGTPEEWKDTTSSNPDPDTMGSATYGNTSAEQDQEDHHHGHEGLAAAAAGAAGAGAVGAGLEHEFGSSKDEAPVKDEELNSSNLAKGDPEEAEHHPAEDFNNETGSETVPTSEPLSADSTQDRSPSQEQDSETFPTSEPVNDMSNQDRSFAPSQEQDESGMMAASEQDEQEDHHGHEGLAAAAAGAAGGGAVGAGLEHEFGSSKDEAPVKDEELNSSNLAKGDPEEAEHHPAEDFNNETGSETVPTSEPLSADSTQDRSPSQEQDSETFPTSEPVNDMSNQDRSFAPSQEQDESGMMAASEQDEQKPMTGTLGYDDSSASQGEELPSKDGELGYAGDQAMADSTPVPEKATDYTAEGEDSPANDTMISSHDQDLSSEEKPISEKPSEAAFQAEESPMQTTNPEATTQAEESPMQTTNPEATTQAEESPMETTNPVHEEGKAPADSKSSASSMPSMFASKLGFGGRNATPSPTSTPKDNSASSAPTSESTQDQPAPASPGLFGRVTAMFGGGAKQPAASEGEN